jgi:hypothetical protein
VLATPNAQKDVKIAMLNIVIPEISLLLCIMHSDRMLLAEVYCMDLACIQAKLSRHELDCCTYVQLLNVRYLLH